MTSGNQDKHRAHAVIGDFLGRTDKGAEGWTDDDRPLG